MWNKDLKSVCTYREPSQESIGESITAFIMCMASMVALWLLLALVAV